MLLQVDYDSGRARRHVFKDCKAYAGKVVLLERVLWFPGSTGEPSDNHAWFVWDKFNRKPPGLRYADSGGEAAKLKRKNEAERC
jgi:hypothetical protein